MDSQIIAMLNARDEQALSLLRACYGGLGQSIAYGILGSQQDAEECVNDALLSVWNAETQIEPRGLKAYFAAMVRHAAIDRRRTQQRVKRGGTQFALALDELAEILPAEEAVEDTVDRRALTASLTDWLRSQPERTCRIFMQRYYFAQSVQEIAEKNGMRESAVKMTLLRARKKLKAHLEKGGFL